MKYLNFYEKLDWLKIRSEHGILIYSTWQGLTKHAVYRGVNSSTTTLWNGLFPIAGCLVNFYNYFYKNFCGANSIDPDQTHSVASDLGLHYLPITFFWVSRQKWVNISPDKSGILTSIFFLSTKIYIVCYNFYLSKLVN